MRHALTRKQAVRAEMQAYHGLPRRKRATLKPSKTEKPKTKKKNKEVHPERPTRVLVVALMERTWISRLHTLFLVLGGKRGREGEVGFCLRSVGWAVAFDDRFQGGVKLGSLPLSIGWSGNFLTKRERKSKKKAETTPRNSATQLQTERKAKGSRCQLDRNVRQERTSI